MKTKDVFGNTLAVVSVICAVATSGVLIRREFFPTRRGETPPPVRIINHERYEVGQVLGSQKAAIRLVVFSDFQCPFCKIFAEQTWSAVRRRFPNDVAMIFRHFPLSIHKNAMTAARAAECAGEQGRFEAFHDRLFKQQDSLGIKSYAQFALDSGVPDTASFRICNSSRKQVAAIQGDIAAARELDSRGTPTVMVNGLKYRLPPTAEQLIDVIEAELRKERRR